MSPNNPRQTAPPPPNFSLMWSGIKSQVDQRKGLLLKRSIAIAWPFSVLSVLLVIGQSSPPESSKPLFITFCCFLPFAIIYAAIMRKLFKLEQLVWIDSFFDGKNLTTDQSRKIAVKLFWPSVRYSLWLLWRYSVPPFLIWVAFLVVTIMGMAAYFTTLGPGDVIINHPILTVSAILLLVSPFALIIYYRYFLQVKIRYAWFLFIDEYNKSDFKVRLLTKRVDELNKARRNGEFKKSFAVFVASEAAGTVADIGIAGVSSAADRLGPAGQLLSSAIEPVAQEGAKQAISFSQMVAIYAMYRYTRWYIYGESQHINEEIYSLINTNSEASSLKQSSSKT